ncbi:MAG: SIR2 family protein [Chromatiales bacterium]
MALLYLFGAGASRFSGPCWPHPPPLGRDLFRELDRYRGIASRMHPDLILAFEDDFERGMDQFLSEQIPHVRQFLCEMATYFCQFKALPGNLYGVLVELLNRNRKKATLVTTNYDLLIESALTRLGLAYYYQGRPVPKRSMALLKIHGSCNFLPDVPGNLWNIGIDLSQAPRGSYVIESPIRPVHVNDWANIISFCAWPTPLAPAISLYHPDKNVLHCRDFVMRQRKEWELSVQNAEVIYVIGLRVQRVDVHIWGPLARATAPLYYVGGEENDFVVWANEVGRKNAYPLASTFEDALTKIARHIEGRRIQPPQFDWTN